LVQGGCLNKGRRHYNGYSVVSLDLQKGEGFICLETYFDDRNAFDKAINKISEGIMPFKIEKDKMPPQKKTTSPTKRKKSPTSKNEPNTPKSITQTPKAPPRTPVNFPPSPPIILSEVDKKVLKIERKELTNVSKVLTIMGARGGVGKSTIACRMAEMLAEKGHNVFIIDLDTGAAGTTSLFRARGFGAINCDTVFDILMRLAENRHSASSLLPAIDVTPDYLSERKNFGRLFLLPAVGQNRSIRIPTVDLLKKIASNDNASMNDETNFPIYIMNEVMSNVERNRVKIDCVIIDCGAEGAEFNPLVTEAHIRSTWTYLVVEWGSVSRDNLSHVAHLITQDNSDGSTEKLRIIVNKLYSLQHEGIVRSQFSDYTVVGCIPDNRQLFEDTQKGTVNHRYGYDSFSTSVRGILTHGHDFSKEYIPDEFDLWVKPTVESIMDGDLVSLFRGYIPKMALILHLIMFLICMAVFGYNSLKVFPLIVSQSEINSKIPELDPIRKLLVFLRYHRSPVAPSYGFIYNQRLWDQSYKGW